MIDFDYSAGMIQRHIDDLHREAAQERLARAVLAGQETNGTRLRHLINRLVGKLSAPVMDTPAVDARLVTGELDAVDLPC